MTFNPEQQVDPYAETKINKKEKKRRPNFEVGDMVRAKRFDLDELSAGWKIIGIGTSDYEEGKKVAYLNKLVSTEGENKGYHQRRVDLETLRTWQE